MSISVLKQNTTGMIYKNRRKIVYTWEKNAMHSRFALIYKRQTSKRYIYKYVLYHHNTLEYILTKMIWANMVNNHRNQGFLNIVKCLLQIFYSSLVSPLIRIFYKSNGIRTRSKQSTNHQSNHLVLSKVAWWIFNV